MLALGTERLFNGGCHIPRQAGQFPETWQGCSGPAFPGGRQVPSGEHVIGHRTDAIDIGPAALPAVGLILFRRREAGIQLAFDAASPGAQGQGGKSGDPDAGLLIHQDIAGTDAAVDQSAPMDRRQRGTQLQHDALCFHHRQRPVFPDILSQGGKVVELTDRIGRTLLQEDLPHLLQPRRTGFRHSLVHIREVKHQGLEGQQCFVPYQH